MSFAELRKLPPEERLTIIEALWSDIATEDTPFESPAWHLEDLGRTEADPAARRTEILDREDANVELRKRFE